MRALARAAAEARAKIPPRQVAAEQVLDGTPVAHLDRPGQLDLRVGYSDGFMTLSDVRHVVTNKDVDPINELPPAHRGAGRP